MSKSNLQNSLKWLNKQIDISIIRIDRTIAEIQLILDEHKREELAMVAVDLKAKAASIED